jgi:hypothetical protein
VILIIYFLKNPDFLKNITYISIYGKFAKGGYIMKSKYKGLVAILILMTMISVVFSGCGSKKESSEGESQARVSISEDNSGLSNNTATAAGDSVKDTMPKDKLKDTLVDSLQGQGKIIRNGTIQMETLSFDETVKQILSKTAVMGAYVQSSNVSGRTLGAKTSEESRSGEFILRIPKTKFDIFISDIGNLGSVTKQQISSEDVTTAYFDAQAHLKSLNIQEERLLELLKKTGELKDIIILENELSRVRYEIEGLTGNLKKWDNLIDYCTLNIQISEVYKIKDNPVSFGDKIVNGFASSVKALIDLGKNSVVIISIFLPYLVSLCILFIAFRYVFLHIKRK